MNVKDNKVVQDIGKGVTKGIVASGKGIAYATYFLGKNLWKGFRYGIKEIKEKKKEAKMGQH